MRENCPREMTVTILFDALCLSEAVAVEGSLTLALAPAVEIESVCVWGFSVRSGYLRMARKLPFLWLCPYPDFSSTAIETEREVAQEKAVWST